MKNALLLACLLLISFCPAQAGNRKPETPPSVERQLTRILMPLGHSNRHLQCIVVVQFQISEDFRICRVQVHASDSTIREQLILQLTGQKLMVSNLDFGAIQTIRVHFQRSDQS